MQKKDIQPFISNSTKDVIYKLSFITGYSVKQIGEDLCTHTLRNKQKLGKGLFPYLKRSIKLGETLYEPSNTPIKQYPLTENLERVSIKISPLSYEFAYSLAYALGWSAAKVVAYCIEQSMKDFDFLNFYITKYLESKMEDNRKEMIGLIMREINKELDEEHSVAALMLGIVDELKAADQNVTEAVSHVVENW